MKTKKRCVLLNPKYGTDALHVRRSFGCFIEDKDGNRLIDTALGAGTHILGHANPLVVSEISRGAEEGTLYILPNEHTYSVVDLLKRASSNLGGFVFCNSGTEATMRAVRIARALTGKKRIAMFAGGWHGGHDMLLFEENTQSDAKRPSPNFRSGGIPEELLDLVLMLPAYDDAALDIIEREKDNLAAVIVEPAQGSLPRNDAGPFLSRLREVTKQNGILLCFDEIITGFRVAFGGCQEYYDVEADIVTYGKTIGGGLSVGLVAGREEVMNVTREGYGGSKAVFTGGTFSANPLVMRVAHKLLSYLYENRSELYPMLNGEGQRLRDSVNEFCVSKNFPARMIGIGSISRLLLTDQVISSRRERDQYEPDQTFQKKFFDYILQDKGVYVSDNRLIFLSTAHKKEHIAKIIDALKDGIEYFSEPLRKHNRIK